MVGSLTGQFIITVRGISHDISDKSPIVTINIDFPLLAEWVVLNLIINLRHNLTTQIIVI